MELVLFGLLAVMIVFMVFNTRRRNKQMEAEREAKAKASVPGAKVLLQSGIYGTIVSYDSDDLAAPAFIELAPGVTVEVHSQAILKVVDDEEEAADDETVAEVPDDASSLTDAEAPNPADKIAETPEETRARLERDSDAK